MKALFQLPVSLLSLTFLTLLAVATPAMAGSHTAQITSAGVVYTSSSSAPVARWNSSSYYAFITANGSLDYGSSTSLNLYAGNTLNGYPAVTERCIGMLAAMSLSPNSGKTLTLYFDGQVGPGSAPYAAAMNSITFCSIQ